MYSAALAASHNATVIGSFKTVLRCTNSAALVLDLVCVCVGICMCVCLQGLYCAMGAGEALSCSGTLNTCPVSPLSSSKSEFPAPDFY